MAVVGMEEQNVNEVGENKAERGEDRAEESRDMAGLSRKEKRKTLKKMKRKQIRKELAEKEKEEEDARLNDPEEQARLKAAEEEEARRRERELKEFEERERAWMEAMELKKKLEEEREEEEKRRRDLEESEKIQQVDEENNFNEDDEWEYIEEGPPEVIFQGNEIILRKKKVRIRKKHVDELGDANRLTSNPLPPESESFADYETAPSASQVLENVAQQVPNFGTEQDKAHCPFHLKTGACRFGQRCSRVHFYPAKSYTLLMKNMYAGPGLAWEQDEGLEHTDEEVEHCYEEFYDDVHTEFMKFGEIINFKVCKNGSFHLRGNVYVHYKSLESAVLAYETINRRYFGGKQVNCEFVNVTKWKVAICGEYMKSRFRACSRGTACNFIHCFRNPGGDYEWADWDKPPPRYWVKKMASLFGYSDEHEKQTEHEHVGLKYSETDISRDSHREPFRRSSRSRDAYRSDNRSGQSYVKPRNHSNDRERTSERRDSRYKDYGSRRSRTRTPYSGECYSDGDMEEDGESVHEGSYSANKTAERKSKWEISSPDHTVVRKKIRLNYSDDERTRTTDDGRKGSEDPKRRSSRNHDREKLMADRVGRERSHEDLNQEMSNRDRDKHRYHQHRRRRTEQHEKITESAGNHKESHDVGSLQDMDYDNTHQCHQIKDSGEYENSSGTPDSPRKSKKGKCHDADNQPYCSDEDGDKSRLRHDKNSGCNDKSVEKDSRNSDRMNHDTDLHRSHRRKEMVYEESAEDGGRNLKTKHYDTDSSERRSERKRQRKRHHSHKRKHSRNHRKYSESPENRSVHCTDSREDSLDRERETSNQESAGLKRRRHRNKWQYDDDDDDDELPKPDGNVDRLDRWKP